MKTLCVMNLKGGTGKTVTADNLADLLAADHGKRVLLIDADHQGNTSRFFLQEAEIASTVGDILVGESEPYWPESVYHTGHEGLDLIPADMSLAELDALPVRDPRAVWRLREFLLAVAEDGAYDYVVIDMPPAFSLAARAALAAPEFVLLFEKNKLPEQTAYALARLPEEFQKRLAGITTDISGSVAEQLLKKYGEGWRWEPEQQCPDGKACKRGDAFLRHDLEHPYDMCGGKKCCLKCERAKTAYSPCDRMCSRAQAVRKDKRDKEKARSEEEKQKQIEQFKAETKLNAQRVLKAVEAAGLTDEEIVPWGYSGRFTVEEIRSFADGEFPENKYWYHAELSVDSLTNPAQTAELLSCSTDYLLGVMDELVSAAPDRAERPEAPTNELEAALLAMAWLPGHPDRSRLVATKMSLMGMAHPLVEVYWYDAETGVYRFSADGPPVEEKVDGWWPLPEEDEE